MVFTACVVCSFLNCWFFLPYGMDGLTQSYIFKQKLQNCVPIDLSCFVVDLREKHLEYWTPYSETHPREHDSKRSTYHQWCALPTKMALVTHSPYILPKIYMFLNLPRDVIRSTARFRLCVHTLRFETATWNQSISPLWPVWYWWCPRWAACSVPLCQSPRDFSPQEICISVSPNRSSRCVYLLEPEQ